MVLALTNLLLRGKNDLSKIWLAAHWDKKLKRYQIYQVNIESSVRDIMSEDIILDLRLSGHLLVGIVKIFSRKTKYLLTECNDIFNRVKLFRSSLTQLSPSKIHAPANHITIPEFENLETLEFGRLNQDEIFISNQSRVEDITLKETAGNKWLLDHDDFGELNFGEGNVPMNFDDPQFVKLCSDYENKENGIGKENLPTSETVLNSEGAPNIESDSDYGPYGGADIMEERSSVSDAIEVPHKVERLISTSQELILLISKDDDLQEKDENELNLEPLPDILNHVERTPRRKRKLIIDEVKTLNLVKIEKQFHDASDIVIPLDLAPPSKRLMILKEVGGSEKLLLLPGIKMGNEKIMNLYKRNLKTYKSDERESSCEEDFSFQSQELCRAEPMHVDDVTNELVDQSGCMNGFSDFEGGIVGHSDSSNDHGSMHGSIDLLNDQINFSNEFQHEVSQSDKGTDNSRYILQGRIIKFLKGLNVSFTRNNEVKFSDLLQNTRKGKAARNFYSLLMLKKFSILEVKQIKSYEEIYITKNVNFDPVCSAIYEN